MITEVYDPSKILIDLIIFNIKFSKYNLKLLEFKKKFDNTFLKKSSEKLKRITNNANKRLIR